MITREQLRLWRACYSDARIAELVPPEGVTLEQVLDSDIPHKDKMWASMHALPRAARLEVLARQTERYIGYGSLTDERLTCLPAAMRADAVTWEMLSAAEAAARAAEAAWAVASAAALAAEAAAAWAASEAAEAEARAAEAAAAAAEAARAAPSPAAERQRQLDDIRELAG